MIEGNIGPFHDLINLAKLLCYLKVGHSDTISRSNGNSRSCNEASYFNPVNYFFLVVMIAVEWGELQWFSGLVVHILYLNII